MAISKSDLIAEALLNALMDADTSELRNQLQDYKRVYWRSWNDLNKQPFCAKLLDAIEEACEYNAHEGFSEALKTEKVETA